MDDTQASAKTSTLQFLGGLLSFTSDHIDYAKRTGNAFAEELSRQFFGDILDVYTETLGKHAPLELP